ncbi:hypothetical protein [Streptomyces sp. NPDC002785]|uniref:hypothetical protein n=1 Tax=Streptomyces sp. NPDC002785 TaxID=3154543 RepID=UPI00331E8216
MPQEWLGPDKDGYGLNGVPRDEELDNRIVAQVPASESADARLVVELLRLQ